MPKQQVAQKYIFKIHTDRLRKAKWKLTLTLAEARDNDEIISIGDSQMLRWIDELNGVTDSEERIRSIRREIRMLRKRQDTLYSRRHIRDLYAELDSIQFKPDYMHLVVDKNKDYLRACKGFTINGIPFVRLLGTSGGVKNNTIVFVSARLAPVLRERIDNGRNTEVQFVPAKLEAYRALTCSGSIPVSMPNGVMVVNDCVTHFQEDVLYLTDENDGEPEIRPWKNFDIELEESDGYGLMLPSLARRWSEELRLDYTVSCVNTRMAWEKGCVFTFDFIEFADKVAGGYIVKDAWGNDVDIRQVELILTTSMLKLWGSYDSMAHYLECCERNRYSFGVAKAAPAELEHMRALNYQFIQSYDLTDEQIDALIKPTVDEINDIIYGDYRKALLFMAGTHLDDRSALIQSDFVRAMMINQEMFNDPFIRQRIQKAIKKRIDDAKIGVLDVHGNYSILCGDPYALCQSIFGLDVTGLLKAGELYNQYWADARTKEVAVFRAPMSCHNNILKRAVVDNDDVRHWYQHITTCTLFNAWDTGCAALNGADKDGDIVFLTDNDILVNNIRPQPTLVCAQKSATKKVVTEEDLIQSNIDGFGNEVGKVTNRVTSMYDVQSMYRPGSIEYDTLAYRIQCGQLYQQNSIDKTKGIVCKPMPKYWYDYRSISRPSDANGDGAAVEFKLNTAIVANKKPYFMRYIYPQTMREYNAFMKKANMSSIVEFRIDLQTLLQMPDDEYTPEMREFVSYFEKLIPVGTHDCVMNRICRKIEDVFTSDRNISTRVPFDYTIMKSGVQYSTHMFYNFKKLYDEHRKKLSELATIDNMRIASKAHFPDYRQSLMTAFYRKGSMLCSNLQVECDIVLDLCYQKATTKQFAWDVVSDCIIDNLLQKAGGVMSYPIRDPDGDITYRGETYSMTKIEVVRDGYTFRRKEMADVDAGEE